MGVREFVIERIPPVQQNVSSLIFLQFGSPGQLEKMCTTYEVIRAQLLAFYQVLTVCVGIFIIHVFSVCP